MCAAGDEVRSSRLKAHGYCNLFSDKGWGKGGGNVGRDNGSRIYMKNAKWRSFSRSWRMMGREVEHFSYIAILISFFTHENTNHYNHVLPNHQTLEALVSYPT